MSHITQIIVVVKTGNASGADADGPVYLGVGSREFRLAKQGNSFERDKTDTFVLGSTGPGGPANVRNSNDNDPLLPIRIELADILGVPFPGPTPTIPAEPPYNVYIRYESDNKWLIETVSVRLIGDPSVSAPSFDVTLGVKFGINSPGVWLGVDSGKLLYLQP